MQTKLTHLFILLFCLVIGACQITDDVQIDYGSLAGQYLDTDLDSAIYYGELATATDTKVEDKIYAHYITAYAYKKQKAYSQAVIHYLDAIRLASEDEKDRDQLASLHKNLGNIFYETTSYQLAIQYFEKGLQYVDDSQKNELTYHLARAHKAAGNLDEALDNYEVLASKSKSKNYSLYAKTLNQIGLINMHLGKNAIAKNKFSDLIKLGFKDYKGRAYHNLAQVFFFESNHIKAIEYYEKALSVKKKEKNRFVSLLDIGECKIKIGDIDNALVSLDEAEKTFNQVKKVPKNIHLFKLLEMAYKAKGDDQKRDHYEELHERLLEEFNNKRDDLIDLANATNMENLVSNYEVQQQVTEELEQQNRLMLGIILLLCLLASGLVITQVKKYRQRQRFKHKMEKAGL